MTTDNEVIQTLNEYLENQTTFTLATSGENGLWISTMFYGYVDGKLYFSSKTKTRHAKEIGKGLQIAFSIADSSQTPAVPTVGLQGVGYCHPSGMNEMPSIIKHYGVRFAEYNDTFGNINALAGLIQGGLNLPFTIEISMIKFLHKPIFGGYRIIEFSDGKITKVYTP